MQLSISNTSDALAINKSNGKLSKLKKPTNVTYISTKALKSTYTEGWTVNNNVSPHTLLTHGFSSWEYANTTREEIKKSSRAKSASYIDYTNGYRTSEKAISLLGTHWLDYDDKLITIHDMATLWKKQLPGIGCVIIPSSSGNGIRILYESTHTTQNIPFGVQILNVELSYLQNKLGVNFDPSKTDPSAHSGHLELQGSYVVEGITYTPEYPTYETFVIIEGAKLNLKIEYDDTYSTKKKKKHQLTAYEPTLFKGQYIHTPIPYDKNRTNYTLPASHNHLTEEGVISTEELYLRVISSKTEYSATASPVGAENSRLESTFWGYDYDKNVLKAKEKGNGKGEYIQNAPRTYTISFKPKTVVLPPLNSMEVAEDHYLLDGKLYRVLSIGHTALNVIEDWAGMVDLELFRDVFECIGQTEKGFILLPNNPYLNIEGAYTIRELLLHLHNVNIYIISTEMLYPTREEAQTARELLSALDTFLRANAVTITSLMTEYGADTPYSVIDRETGELTLYKPYHSIQEPKYKRPEQEHIDWYYNFARQHQYMDIKALATAVVAKSRDALPRGIRLAAWYQNASPGIGKTEWDKAFVALGISPSVELTEYMEEGGNGRSISSYSQYLLNSIDEADRFDKKIPKFVRQATSKGISGRVIYGMSESARINFLLLSTASGIKGYEPEFMDEQDIDRVMKHTSIDRRKFSELTREEVPYSIPELRAMLHWAIYDAFSDALGTIEKDKPVDFDFSPFIERTNSNVTAIAMKILAGGIQKFKDGFYVVDGKVKPRNVEGLDVYIRPYSKCKSINGERDYLDGIYWSGTSLLIDSMEVAFDYIESTGASKILRNLINTNKNELLHLLGIPMRHRTSVSLYGNKDYYKITSMPFTEEQLDKIWTKEKDICHPFLKDKTLEEIEEMYKIGAKTNADREQMAELVIAYYTKLEIEATTEQQVVEVKGGKLW